MQKYVRSCWWKQRDSARLHCGVPPGCTDDCPHFLFQLAIFWERPAKQHLVRWKVVAKHQTISRVLAGAPASHTKSNLLTPATAAQIKAILFSLFSLILWHDRVRQQTRDELLQIRALPEALYTVSRRNRKLLLIKQGCSHGQLGWNETAVGSTTQKCMPTLAPVEFCVNAAICSY